MCTVLYWNSNTALSFWNAGFQEVVKFTKSRKKTNTLTIPFFWDRFVPKNYVLNGTHMCVLLQLILSNFWLLCTQQWSKFCTRGASIGWKHDLISKLSSVICILKITSVALIRTKTFVLEIETFFFFPCCVLCAIKIGKQWGKPNTGCPSHMSLFFHNVWMCKVGLLCSILHPLQRLSGLCH